MKTRTCLLREDERAKLAAVLDECPFIIAAYQFGSTIRDKAGPLSDLDIALLLAEAAPSGVALARVEGLLAYRAQQALTDQPREIDVSSLNEHSIIFQHTVLHTGQVIYDANPQARRHYEWKIIQAYLDFEPTLRWMSRFQKEGWLRRCGIR